MFCQHGHCHVINELDASSKNLAKLSWGTKIPKKLKQGDHKADF
jgi:hypothetical protein